MNTPTPTKHQRLHIFLDKMTKLLMVVVFLGAIWFSYDHFMDGGKSRNLDEIKSKLNSYNEIKVIKVGSKNDAIVLTNIFATFQTSPGKILTLSGINSNTFDQLNSETLSRIGSWGIATLLIFPKQEDNPIKYMQGIRITRDPDFLEFIKNKKIEKFDDLISRFDLLQNYLNSLPELKENVISESFFNTHAKQLKNDWGFEGHYHWIRWRFKTDFLGNAENDFEKQPQSIPRISQDLSNQIFKDQQIQE